MAHSLQVLRLYSLVVLEIQHAVHHHGSVLGSANTVSSKPSRLGDDIGGCRGGDTTYCPISVEEPPGTVPTALSTGC